ncbi:MAG TPA: FAD-dependent oxidoreductase [Nitrospira sp.]|nr:FAD-dependent oxidoreductase [Nitrospira sp.]
MAVPKTAEVVLARTVGDHTRLLELEIAEPLGFLGGQYMIIDSGLVASNGKAIKRAYSLISSDDDQRRVQLAVQHIPNGPGSDYIHGLEPGAKVSFSGPWGKFYLREDTPGSTLVFSTDTGVTAALGLIQSMRFFPLLDGTMFIWLRPSVDYFLPEEYVRGLIPAECCDVRIGTIPATNHDARLPAVRTVLRQILFGPALTRAFVSGDGAVNVALLDDLVSAGVPVSNENVESFFNMPKKSA